MSNYPPPGTPVGYPPPGYPVQPPPSGCGCGGCLGKLFILLGVIFFVMLLLCGGGIFVFVRTLAKSLTEQPAELIAINDEIITMRVPAPLQPVWGGRFAMPFTHAPVGQGVNYAAPNKKAVLIVGSITHAYGPQLHDWLRSVLESGPNQQKAGNNDDLNEKLNDAKTSEIERTIDGEKVTFKITEGVGVHSGKKKIQAEGTFPSKIGPAFLVITAEADTLSREKVDAILQSLGEEEKAGK